MMNEAIKQYSNKSVSFEDWTKGMTEQSQIFSEALKNQGAIMDDAIRQYTEMNSKMFDYAIQHYSGTNSKLIQDAIKSQGQMMDDIIKRQGRIFDDAIEQFSQKNAKMLDEATKRQADETNPNNVKKKKR
jgi:polyhydroxyalkanoate synthesis regulator protein